MALDTMSEADDDALIAAYAAGDPAAARALTLRLAPRVAAHATRLLGDRAEAEDVAQEAMLKLWRIAPDWRAGEAKASTWLYRVTANLCTDRLRRRRRMARPLGDDAAEVADPAPDAVAQLTRGDRADALRRALATLPARQREAVVLRHIEGMANPDIGRIMDLSPRAVESLIARGKRALTALLIGRRDEIGWTDD